MKLSKKDIKNIVSIAQFQIWWGDSALQPGQIKEIHPLNSHLFLIAIAHILLGRKLFRLDE